MFADPQSVTVNAVAQSLPAVSRETFKSTYRKDDTTYELVIAHDEKTRNRRTVRLNNRKIAADPLVTSQNAEYTMSAYLVIDHPNDGYTNTELKDIVLGLVGWLTSANILKVVGGES